MKSRHLSFRSGNPALSSKVFENTTQRKQGALLIDDVMTIKGTVDKTAISLILLLTAGYFSFSE
jgi:uncharacterized YccA/Bax inhibitor family protein